MGAMSPQPTDQQQQQQQGVQQHGAPVQYPQPTADQQHGAIQQHQQPLPPGYAQEKPMDPASAPQHVFPPQGQMYPAQPQAYGTPLVSLNQQPAPVACPRCSHRGMTEVEYESGGFTQYV
ncbi:LITAF-like zinc ribbon domain-containing protein [Candidatus Bathyarchaeota archaeon]|nr:LITAF-like zinc ribbon domain-containing protein [Candidatus Bathyarchaeota archaeon]